jgi:protease-4
LPVAGEEIANAIKQSEKPVIAVIRQTGASAAYLAISSSDKIFASKNSDVGGIGVTSSYLSNTIKNQQDGYTYEQLTAGKYKDSGNPDKPLTVEEKKLFLRDINIVYENFIEAVSQNRNMPLEKVRALADGSTMLGEEAMKQGLIDEIGDMDEAQAYITKTIGEKSDICWY